jgi:hypothetical protein
VNETAGDKKRELCRGKRAAGIVAKKAKLQKFMLKGYQAQHS